MAAPMFQPPINSSLTRSNPVFLCIERPVLRSSGVNSGSLKKIEPFKAVSKARNIKIAGRPFVRVQSSQNGSGVTDEALNIVFVSAEVAPWSKTGGLGDVVGGLPVELARLGHPVMSIAPRYDQYADLWDTSVTANIDGEEVRYFHSVKDGVDRVFVDHPWFLAKVWGKTGGKLYGQKSGSDYMDNQRRFLLFNKAALKALELLPFGPGTQSVVVANDWHTAVLPLLVKEVYQKNGHYKDMKTALCIHNIAFQGRFWRKNWDDLNLPDRVKTFFEFVDGYPKVFVENEPEEMIPAMAPGSTFEKLNWLQAGLLTADKLLTVSPNYATEIAEDEEKGVELAGAVRAAGGLEGIVNGIDVSEWSPFLDKYLDVKYDVETLDEGKAVAKESLQAELGLEVNPNIPVFGFIGRLEEQKGVDILTAALPEVAKTGGCQIVILGTGKKMLEQTVLKLDKQYPDIVKGVVKFDVPLAHLMTAGCDYMLVPSRFEPCGLIQLHAMNYGTVPVVSSTGGLVDTVKEGVTGFHAGRFNPDKLDLKDASALAQTIKRSSQEARSAVLERCVKEFAKSGDPVYRHNSLMPVGSLRASGAFHTAQFKTMRQRCIVQDLSWETPARKWQSVLKELKYAPSTQSVQYTASTKPYSSRTSGPSRQSHSSEQRKTSYPTPVQEVNREGDAVSPNAVARKSSASQAVKERKKPAGISPTGSGPGAQTASSTRPFTPRPGSPSSPTPIAPQRSPTTSSGAASSSGPLRAAGAKATTRKPSQSSASPNGSKKVTPSQQESSSDSGSSKQERRSNFPRQP